MSAAKLWITGVAIGLISASTLLADDPTTQPTDGHAKRHVRLVEPWSEMKDLSPDQADKIAKIHADALAQKKMIDERADDAIMNMLSAEQKKEVQSIEDKKAADRKEKAAERRTKKDATTQPAK